MDNKVEMMKHASVSPEVQQKFNELFSQREQTEPGSPEAMRVAEKILKAIFNAGE